MVNDHSFVGSGCTWVLGRLSEPCKACILWSAGKFVAGGFAHQTTQGSLGDGVEVVGREETKAMRVAFNIYLKGLLFAVKRCDYYLMLCGLYLLGCSQPLGRHIHFSPLFIREVLEIG